MSTRSVIAATDRPAIDTARELAALDRLAELLDGRWRILGVPIGLDAIIGLVPGAGDLIGAGLSCWLIARAARLGVGRAVIVRMLANVAIDVLAGALPLIGDLADVAWRANRRNVALLRRALARPSSVGERLGPVRRRRNCRRSTARAPRRRPPGLPGVPLARRPAIHVRSGGAGVPHGIPARGR